MLTGLWWFGCPELPDMVAMPLPQGVIEGSCAVRVKNGSRVFCEATTGQSVAVDFVVEDLVDGRVVTVSSPAGTVHEGLAVGLVAERTFQWRVVPVDGSVGASGEVTTRALPDDLAWIPVITGSPSGFDALLIPWSCNFFGRLVMVDPMGRPVWYDNVSRLTADLVASVQGIQWTPERTVLVVVDRARVLEMSLAGDVLMDLEMGVQFDEAVHHDAARWGDETLLLLAEEAIDGGGVSFVNDGVRRFDAQGVAQGDWWMNDFIDPTGFVPSPLSYWTLQFPLSNDVFHTNAISVDPQGDWLLSLRNMSAVLHVGGPHAEDAGVVRWVLAGDDSAPLVESLAWTSSAGVTPLDLYGQHAPSFTKAGTVILLDNRAAGPSRVLEIAIDAEAGIADVIRSWDLGLECSFQGGVAELENGDLVATCAKYATLIGLARAGGEAWRMGFECPLQIGFLTAVRGLPIQGLWESTAEALAE